MLKRAMWVVVLLVLSAASAAAQSQALTRATLARDTDVQLRIMFLGTKVALSVMSEDPSTCCGENPEASQALHAKREIMASIMLREPQGLAFRIALAVLTDTTLNAQSTDAEIEATIRAQWDAYSQAVAR